MTASFTFLEIQGLQDHQDDASTSSLSATDHGERWEAMDASDDRPGIPSRKASSNALNLQDSQSITFSEDNLTIQSASLDEEGPRKVVLRSVSSDSLPLMPKRQASSQQLVSTSNPKRPIRTRSPIRPRRGRKLGPPSIPRRQASGKNKDDISKSLTLPMRPKRCPSFKSCAGTAA